MDFCPACGARIVAQDRVCPACGRPVAAAAPTSPLTQPPSGSGDDLIAVLLGLGFVAFGVAQILDSLLTMFPLSSHVGSWYGTRTLVAIGVIGAVAYYGFRTALAGRPLLGRPVDE